MYLVVVNDAIATACDCVIELNKYLLILPFLVIGCVRSVKPLDRNRFELEIESLETCVTYTLLDPVARQTQAYSFSSAPASKVPAQRTRVTNLHADAVVIAIGAPRPRIPAWTSDLALSVVEHGECACMLFVALRGYVCVSACMFAYTLCV